MNKTVLITGATSGIGLGCAKKFAENGDRLILTGRNPEKLDEIQRELEGKGCQVLTLVFDVRDRAAAAEAGYVAAALGVGPLQHEEDEGVHALFGHKLPELREPSFYVFKFRFEFKSHDDYPLNLLLYCPFCPDCDKISSGW